MKRETIDSKTRISNAALSLFIKRGIKGTTTKEIARRAGIAESVIYKHFKNKDDLALRLFLNCMDLFRDRLLKSINNQPNAKGKLKALIEAFFDFAKSEPKAYSYIMVGHHTELSKVPVEWLKPKDIFVEVIRDGIGRGEFRQIDENTGVALIIGMITRVILFFDNRLIGQSYGHVVSEVVKASFKVLDAR